MNVVKKLIALLISLLTFVNSSVFADYYDGVLETAGRPDVSNWIEWHYPNDKEAIGTAIDASGMLDAPAGKHGFLHAKGRKMYFDDGTQIRFWGTNISMMGVFLEKEDADILVDRIARVGFNLVRIHNIDTYTNNCIFNDGKTSDPRKINENQFNKLCYLISKFKERGIYVYVDMTASRNVNPGEKDIHLQKYLSQMKSKAFAPLVFFNNDLRDINKDYAKQLYCTKNPYTGLSLAEDPVLAFVDIQNEFGGLTYTGGMIEEGDSYYFAEATAKWNRWLLNKYGSTEKLKSAWRESGKVSLNDKENLTDGTVVFIDDVSLEYPNVMDDVYNYSKARIDDWKYFMYESWKDYNVDIRDYLKNALGMKCLITSVGSGGTTNFKQPTPYQNASEFDYTDAHSYKSHPISWGLTVGESITSWSSVLMKGGQEQNRFLWYYGPHDQPFVVGEWQMCYPGIHSSEGNIFQAIFCSKQEWNPLEYCMIGNFPEWNTQNYVLPDSFQTFYDAAKTSIQPLAAMVFLHNDIKPFENEYYFRITYEESEDDRLLLDQNHFLGLDTVYTHSKTAGYYPSSKNKYSATPEKLEEALSKQKNDEMSDDQLYWNINTGIMTLSSDCSNVAMGYIGDKDISLDFMDLKVDNYYASVILTSITNEPLKTARRMVLGAVIEGRDRGLVLDDASASTVTKAAEPPMMLKPTFADVTLKTTDNILVYPLNESGKRIGEVPVEKDENGFSKFRIDGTKYQAVHYEVVRK